MSYNKRIQKIVKRLGLSVDPEADHVYICDHHDEIIEKARSKKKEKKTEDLPDEEKLPVPTVDLGQLQLSTLKRYKKHFNVATKSGLNKAQLAEALQAHFNTMEVDEKDVLTHFVYNVKKEDEKRNPKSSLEDLADEN